MKHKVVIEIDGVRHVLFNNDKVISGCMVCSLAELCIDVDNSGICFPFLKRKKGEYGHFELVDKQH